MWLLKKLVYPFSLLYGLVVWFRNWCYDIGVFTSTSFTTPIICVGNLSVGGTGKTPMIEYLVALLQDQQKVAVLSRGYKRKSKGFLLANSTSLVDELGDEPFQIWKKFPKIALAVDADRVHGITELKKRVDPSVILLDDAFQHRKVKAGFYMLLTAYDNLYDNDFYLPTGTLRDSKAQAKRADLIVVTKCPTNLTEKERIAIKQRLKLSANQTLVFSAIGYAKELKSNTGVATLDELKDKKFTLVTGIANPKPLVQFLKEKDMSFEHLSYEDHHFFSAKEFELMNSKELIITTEKDFVRLNSEVKQSYYLPITHRFLNNDGLIFESCILKYVAENS